MVQWTKTWRGADIPKLPVLAAGLQRLRTRVADDGHRRITDDGQDRRID